MLVISSVVTMFFYSPILTFIALIISVLTAFVSIRINNSIKKHAKNVQNKSARLATLFSDIISGFVTLKMNSGASIVLKHFYKENGESAQAERSRVRMEASLEMAAFLLGDYWKLWHNYCGRTACSRWKAEFRNSYGCSHIADEYEFSYAAVWKFTGGIYHIGCACRACCLISLSWSRK